MTAPSSEKQAVDRPAQAADQDALRKAFLEGLGASHLDVPRLTPAFMESLGALMRVLTAGTIELLRVRAETKSSLHGDMTMIDSRAINPLKAAWDADVALQHLFAPRRQDMQDPLHAVTEAYSDLRAHDRELAAGVRAALAGLLARFDPQMLEKRLGDDHMLDSFVPGARKARRWDSFVEAYGDVRMEAEQDFWAAFENEIRAAAARERDAVPSTDKPAVG